MFRSPAIAGRITLGAVTLSLLFACGEEMGPLEAADALAQSSRSGEGVRATSEPIEVSTDFTIGGALEDAAAELAVAVERLCSDSNASQVDLVGHGSGGLVAAWYARHLDDQQRAAFLEMFAKQNETFEKNLPNMTEEQ